MTRSTADHLRHIRKLLVLLAAEIAGLGKSALLPLLDCAWHSLSDLFRLVAASATLAQWRRAIVRHSMRLERRLEKHLPDNWRHRQPVKSTGLLLLLILLLVMVSGDTGIEDLRRAGELRVISRESPTTLYHNGGQPVGPEYDYLASFAGFLGVELQLDLRDNHHEVLAGIRDNEAHIAAGMTYHPALEEQGRVFGPGYQEVDVQVVCRRNHGPRPRAVEDLEDVELVVIADSSYESRMFDLQEDFPDLTWESERDGSVDELLERVWRKEIGCTVANSSEISIKRRFYPELQVAFTIGGKQSLAWNLSPEWATLSGAIDQWLAAIENDGTLMILQDRHYPDVDFDYVDMRSFIRRIDSALPELEPLFRQAAAKHRIPWTLLAAQAYQESHWNRRARSPTGVRGIMMLTLTTAREMGVESRLDAAQSIKGGAKYLSWLESRIPDSVAGDERWWFALAAYNVGMGHLQDARRLAAQLKVNPDSWLDLQEVLPLLSDEQYYQHLKYGRARGNEPVEYVRRVRNYQNTLLAQIAHRQRAEAG